MPPKINQWEGTGISRAEWYRRQREAEADAARIRAGKLAHRPANSEKQREAWREINQTISKNGGFVTSQPDTATIRFVGGDYDNQRTARATGAR